MIASFPTHIIFRYYRYLSTFNRKKMALVIVAVLQDPLAQAALLDLSLKEEEVEQWVTCLAAKFNASAR